ncbi:dihydrofolate reductase [Amorphus coralli]|uniref:dihydrofolate reductase n=1 Tax=Amorphus coralli TaxID=340680 RepID=UPI00058CF8A8|nr:dihydrofolate reductase [Amorphus coralli]
MSGSEGRSAIVLVAAVSETGVIGRDNAMPWHLSSDFKRFKALTMGKPMVMGRKTFQSIGKALPGRRTIVVTRDAGFTADGIETAPNLAAALERAAADARQHDVAEIMVVGGGQIYAEALPLADRLEITHVHARIEGDAVFPAIDPAAWEARDRSELPAGARDDHAMSFVTYRRRANAGENRS